MLNNPFLLALSTLVGTTIGAGIFGLPSVVAQSGIVVSLLYLVVLGGGVLLLHLFLGEVALRTKEKHRIIGYSRMYLGRWAEFLAVFSTVFGVVGSLLAYLIVGGDFLGVVAGDFISFSPATYSLIFWVFLSAFIFKGIQLIAKAEFFMNLALFAAVAVVFAAAAPHVKIENIPLVTSSGILLPFGVVFFAFVGWAAIPEIADLFKKRKDRKSLDNVVITSSLVVGALYLLFAFFVVGVSGAATTEEALQGLLPFLGKGVVTVGALFGLIAIAASYLVLGNYLKNSLRYDYKVPALVAAGVAVFTPLLLYVIGFREFIQILGVVGGVVGVVEGFLITSLFIAARKKGTRKPEYVVRIPFVK